MNKEGGEQGYPRLCWTPRFLHSCSDMQCVLGTSLARACRWFEWKRSSGSKDLYENQPLAAWRACTRTCRLRTCPNNRSPSTSWFLLVTPRNSGGGARLTLQNTSFFWGLADSQYFSSFENKANPYQYHIFRFHVLKPKVFSDFHFCITLRDELALALAGKPGQELLKDRDRLSHWGHLVCFHIPLYLDQGHCNSHKSILFYLRLLLILRKGINFFNKL